MKYEDLDEDMKSIIQECQADFIRDSNERFDLLVNKQSEMQNGSASSDEFIETVLQQVHAMKGVARTIYYEVFHKKSELLIYYIREHQESKLANIDLSFIKDEVHALRRELADCKVFE